MNRQPIQITTSRLIMLFVIGVIAGALLLFSINYLAQNGLPSLGRIQDVRSMPIISVSYTDVYRYLNSRVQTKGYVIITNDTDNICGMLGWSTCNVWLDNDPLADGLGLHEVKIHVGDGADSITPQGDLYDHYGNHLKMTRTDQFGWYHVSVTGLVEKCSGRSCTITVDQVTAIP
ncbi:MAG: hypothetical protein LWX83_00345 [Anaerolineae bacterium]|nr:hypothetical protein [Anaerolineae bacterium]